MPFPNFMIKAWIYLTIFSVYRDQFSYLIEHEIYPAYKCRPIIFHIYILYAW